MPLKVPCHRVTVIGQRCPTPPLSVVVPAAEGAFAAVMLDAHPASECHRQTGSCRRQYSSRPTSVPPSDRFSVPLWTLTVPLLLNVVLIVEVTALPLLVKVPRLFTNAVLPVVGTTSGGGGDAQPIARRLIVERRTTRDRQNTRTSLSRYRVGSIQD